MVVVFGMQQLAQLASTSAATLSFSPQHRVRAPVPTLACLLRPKLVGSHVGFTSRTAHVIGRSSQG